MSILTPSRSPAHRLKTVKNKHEQILPKKICLRYICCKTLLGSFYAKRPLQITLSVLCMSLSARWLKYAFINGVKWRIMSQKLNWYQTLFRASLQVWRIDLRKYRLTKPRTYRRSERIDKCYKRPASAAGRLRRKPKDGCWLTWMTRRYGRYRCRPHVTWR